MAERYEERSFAGNPERSFCFLPRIESLYDTQTSFRLIDVGCGNGAMIQDFCNVFPSARFLGVDLSPANIEEARRNTGACGERATFEAADIMHWQGEPADVVVSDSTLQLVDGDTRELTRVLARMITPGGRLIIAMPVASARNTALLSVRRMARALRCKPLDAALLFVAKLVYGRGDFSEEALRQRIEYMYCVPPRLYGLGLSELLSQAGFTHLETLPDPQRYTLKLDHVITVWTRT